jgi:quercetin dioxygenase-like cupin family protein
MKSKSESGVFYFSGNKHIKNVLDGDWVDLLDNKGVKLRGIRGRVGACAIDSDGIGVGVDLIEMSPGSSFTIHQHPGSHLLYILSGNGFVNIDNLDYRLTVGDTIFIPAEFSHGVRTDKDQSEPLVIISFGYPHKHLNSKERMVVV